MKAATIREIKQELGHKSEEELVVLCLRLAKFKKENKELLTYLLYEASNEEGYIDSIKREIDEQFELLNKRSVYLAKKGIRKILRTVKKYIRYSKKKETEVELLLYFCSCMAEMSSTMRRSQVLVNLYIRQIQAIKKKVKALHEDLQFDYELEIRELLSPFSE